MTAALDTTGLPGRYVAVHLLRTVNAVNLNAGADGNPKWVRYGNARRGRVSSQAIKRAMRAFITTRLAATDMDTATRTRHLPSAVAAELDHPDAAALAAILLRGSGFTINASTPGLTEELVFAPTSAISALAAIATTHQDVLAEHVPGFVDAVTNAGPKQRKPRGKSTVEAGAALPVPGLPRPVVEAVRAALAPGASIEMALAGRMLTAIPDGDVPGSLAVAHAFTVGPVEEVNDVWAATDDWGDAGFTTALFQDGASATTLMSGTFYQWLQLDRHQFAQTYAGPDPAAALATAERLLIEAAVKATPRAKGRSTGAYTLPDLVVIVTADEPIPTVSCFEDAVGGDHVPQDAAARLASALWFSDTLIGYRGVRVLWGLPGEQPQFPAGRS